MKKKSILKSAIVLLLIAALMIPLFGCASSGPADGVQGKYWCEWERGPVLSRDKPNYYYTLDGHGKGEYYHKDSTHKIKYTYNSDGTIYITDTISGVKYNGTLENGELHIYDGNKDNVTVTEFLFIKE